jgi:hypothetical protein
MAELSKLFKIVLIINIIAAFIYGILYLFIPEIYAIMIESPSFSLQFWRLWGVTCFILGIMGIVGLLRNDWMQLRILFEFSILWLIGMNILNIIYLFDPSHTAMSLTSEVTDVIIIFVLIVLDIYAYLRENKQ